MVDSESPSGGPAATDLALEIPNELEGGVSKSIVAFSWHGYFSVLGSTFSVSCVVKDVGPLENVLALLSVESRGFGEFRGSEE